MGVHTYQTKRCPQCGKIYEKRSIYGSHGREAFCKFAPPIVICPHCQAMLKDSDCYELAFMDPPVELFTKIHISSYIGSGLFAVLGISVLGKSLGLTLVFLIFAVLLPVMD